MIEYMNGVEKSIKMLLFGIVRICGIIALAIIIHNITLISFEVFKCLIKV